MPKRLQKSSVKKRVPVRSVSKIKTYQSSEKPDQVGEIWQNNIIGSLDNGYSKEQAIKPTNANPPTNKTPTAAKRSANK